MKGNVWTGAVTQTTKQFWCLALHLKWDANIFAVVTVMMGFIRKRQLHIDTQLLIITFRQ